MIKSALTLYRESMTPKDLAPADLLSSSLSPHADINAVFQPCDFHILHTHISHDPGRKQVIHTKGVIWEFTRLSMKVWTGLWKTRGEGHDHLQAWRGNVRELFPGPRVRWVTLWSWSYDLPAALQRGELGRYISELCLPLPSILHLLYPIGWTQSEVRRPRNPREAFCRGQPQGTEQGGQGWRVALERQIEHGAYTLCFIMPLHMTFPLPESSPDPDPLSFLPCSHDKLILNHQDSCPAFQFKQQPVHTSIIVWRTLHCNCLFTCLSP